MSWKPFGTWSDSPRAPRTSQFPSSVDSTSVRLTPRAAAEYTSVVVRHAASAWRAASAGLAARVRAQQHRGLAGVDLMGLGVLLVLPSAEEPGDRGLIVGAVDPSILRSELESAEVRLAFDCVECREKRVDVDPVDDPSLDRLLRHCSSNRIVGGRGEPAPNSLPGVPQPALGAAKSYSRSQVQPGIREVSNLWGTKTQSDLTATAQRNRNHMSRPSGRRVAQPRGGATALIRSNIRAPQQRQRRPEPPVEVPQGEPSRAITCSR